MNVIIFPGYYPHKSKSTSILAVRTLLYEECAMRHKREAMDRIHIATDEEGRRCTWRRAATTTRRRRGVWGGGLLSELYQNTCEKPERGNIASSKEREARIGGAR
jgi:hypothetical protein